MLHITYSTIKNMCALWANTDLQQILFCTDSKIYLSSSYDPDLNRDRIPRHLN